MIVGRRAQRALRNCGGWAFYRKPHAALKRPQRAGRPGAATSDRRRAAPLAVFLGINTRARAFFRQPRGFSCQGHSARLGPAPELNSPALGRSFAVARAATARLAHPEPAFLKAAYTFFNRPPGNINSTPCQGQGCIVRRPSPPCNGGGGFFFGSSGRPERSNQSRAGNENLPKIAVPVRLGLAPTDIAASGRFSAGGLNSFQSQRSARSMALSASVAASDLIAAGPLRRIAFKRCDLAF